MNILAIDTSNPVLGVSILKNNKIIGEVVTDLPINHSVRLMPVIDRFMKEVNITPNELDQIIVAKGPGSYTGVRIGITTAKSLAWALNIPVVGVSSLEALAYQGRFFTGYICPFFDARRQTIYTGLYKWINNELTLVNNEKNILMVNWLDQLKSEQKEVLFLSPDIDLYKETINRNLGQLAIVPEAPYHISRPSHLALVGLSKKSENVHTLTPNYLRLAEAEANWIKAQKENSNG